MSTEEVECPKCRSKILADKLAQAGTLACYGCGNILHGTVFPAVHHTQAEKPTLSNPATGEDAVCFYREDQRATAVCAQCGVFVSEMYRVRIGDDDYCTHCVAKSREENNIPALITRSTLRDYQAMMMALFPLIIFFPIVIITAPYVLFLVFRYRKNPGGIVPRSNWRMPTAATIAVFELIGVVAFGIMIWQEAI